MAGFAADMFFTLFFLLTLCPASAQFFSNLAQPHFLGFPLLNIIRSFGGRPVIGRPRGLAELSLSTLEERQKMLGEAPTRSRRAVGMAHEPPVQNDIPL